MSDSLLNTHMTGLYDHTLKMTKQTCKITLKDNVEKKITGIISILSCSFSQQTERKRNNHATK